MGKTLTGLTMALAFWAAPLVAQEQEPAGESADTARSGHMMHRMHGQGTMPGMRSAQPSPMDMMQRMRGQAGMMGPGMMAGGMMGMSPGPAMILRLEESLELTDAQVEELEGLQETARSEMHQHMMQAMQGMRAARELLASPSPDLDAYEADLREAASHMVLAHTVMARASVEARNALTPEQRDRLALARDMMRQMHGGGMDGGMMPGMMRESGHDGAMPEQHGHSDF